MRILGILFFGFSLAALSGCRNNLELIEKSDVYKPTHQNFSKIILLQPDFYFSNKNEDDVFKNEKAIEIEKLILGSSKRAAKRFGIYPIIPGKDDSISSIYFNDIERLKQEMTSTGYIYNLDNMKAKINYPNTEPLSANLILSPDLQSLQKKYGASYFYQTTIVQYKKDIFILAALADVGHGKIVYRELIKVNSKPRKSMLNLLIFNAFNDMLIQK